MKICILGVLTALVLGGCAAKNEYKSLYCWGGGEYANSVMDSVNDEADTLAAIQKMETGLSEMMRTNCTPLPGYYAHLGLLYSKIGKNFDANAYFEKEKEIFPESSQFLYFIKSSPEQQKAIVSGNFKAENNATKAAK